MSISLLLLLLGALNFIVSLISEENRFKGASVKKEAGVSFSDTEVVLTTDFSGTANN